MVIVCDLYILIYDLNEEQRYTVDNTAVSFLFTKQASCVCKDLQHISSELAFQCPYLNEDSNARPSFVPPLKLSNDTSPCGTPVRKFSQFCSHQQFHAKGGSFHYRESSKRNVHTYCVQIQNHDRHEKNKPLLISNSSKYVDSTHKGKAQSKAKRMQTKKRNPQVNCDSRIQNTQSIVDSPLSLVYIQASLENCYIESDSNTSPSFFTDAIDLLPNSQVGFYKRTYQRNLNLRKERHNSYIISNFFNFIEPFPHTNSRACLIPAFLRSWHQ